ncbi:helix-turn-helix transcriptional regulator [Micromonospora sp. NPDC005298]|uniref:helix-turn-helix transcriptional regulator n=1 Tax=Micromonospora sp. NPDC005298 TaxID=3156873 RepID=UPI0033B39643
MPETPLTNRRAGHTGGSSIETADERRVLHAVAVADAPCDRRFLEQMLAGTGGTSSRSFEATVAALIADNVLVDTPVGLRLSSSERRETILASVPPPVRRTLHETAGLVLAATGYPAQAAGQLLRAMPVASHAARTAVAHLVTEPAVSPTLAADLMLATGAPDEPDARLDWLIATADNLFLAARLTEGLALLHDEVAAHRYGPHQRAVLLDRMAVYYASQRPSLSMTYLERALDQHPDAADRSWFLTTLAEVAARYGHRDTGRLLAEAERAHTLAPTPGGAVRLAMARAASATGAGHLPRAGQILREVDGAEPATRSQGVLLRVDRIANEISRGRFAEARTALDALITEIDTIGVAARPLFTALDCVARLAVGEFSEAEARARLALKGSADERLDGARLSLLATVVEVLLHRGEVAVARALLASEDPTLDWPDGLRWYRLGCAVAGDPEPERHGALVRATIDLTERSLAQLLLVPHHGPRLVRAALTLGDTVRAETLANHLKRVAGRTNDRLWRGVAHHVDGLVTGDPGALRTAVARLRTTSARPALADALLDLASSPRVPAREALAAAQTSAALYVRLGASGDEERARRVGRAITDRDRNEAPERCAGVDALTPAEARVAELLARGATKQQAASELFLSFHTVDTHLRAIYGKLGVRSRVALARAWDARETGA